MDITIVGIGVVGLVIFLSTLYCTLNLYQKCSPSQAMIITGAVPGGIQVVRGGGAVVWPLVNQMHFLSLAVMTVNMESQANMTDREDQPVHLAGTAHVKVTGEDQAIIKAAECFVGKADGEITKIAQEILSGHLGAVVATMSAEEIKRSLDSLAQKVREMSSVDLAKMGLEVESLSLT